MLVAVSWWRVVIEGGETWVVADVAAGSARLGVPLLAVERWRREPPEALAAEVVVELMILLVVGAAPDGRPVAGAVMFFTT